LGVERRCPVAIAGFLSSPTRRSVDLSVLIEATRQNKRVAALTKVGVRGRCEARSGTEMNDWSDNLGLASADDVTHPLFVAHLKCNRAFAFKPDDMDFDGSITATMDEERRGQYHLAQARKLMRLYRTWKQEQN
jgi:hypothetical protein